MLFLDENVPKCLLMYVCSRYRKNPSNQHASYEIPPLINIFESSIILSLDSLLYKNRLEQTVTGFSELCVTIFFIER